MNSSEELPDSQVQYAAPAAPPRISRLAPRISKLVGLPSAFRLFDRWTFRLHRQMSVFGGLRQTSDLSSGVHTIAKRA